MVIVNTWVFILRRYKWHIHAGSWSLVNCLAGSLDEALYRVLMNINECSCRPYGWLGLDGNRCIRVIPRQLVEAPRRERTNLSNKPDKYGWKKLALVVFVKSVSIHPNPMLKYQLDLLILTPSSNFLVLIEWTIFLTF